MSNYTWESTFRQCWEKAVAHYAAGNRQPATYFNAAETKFLAGIGCSAQELYDFAEDWSREKEPTFETVLLITAARRDYFLVIQKCQPTGRVVPMSELPEKKAAVAGFEWLPRVIEKARIKLRGEMSADLMYGCGGDRAFFKKVNIHPADFLREVWAARNDDQKIVEYVRHATGKR